MAAGVLICARCWKSECQCDSVKDGTVSRATADQNDSGHPQGLFLTGWKRLYPRSRGWQPGAANPCSRRGRGLGRSSPNQSLLIINQENRFYYFDDEYRHVNASLSDHTASAHRQRWGELPSLMRRLRMDCVCPTQKSCVPAPFCTE